MAETLQAGRGISDGTRRVLNLGLYNKQTTALGATTVRQRLAVSGISRATYYRWRRGLSAPDLEYASRVAAKLGIPVEDLFAEVAA